MAFSGYILVTLATVIGVANIYVTYKCLKSDYLEWSQKAFQVILVWLFPILGATLVYSLSGATDKGPNYKTTDAHPYTVEKAIPPGEVNSSE